MTRPAFENLGFDPAPGDLDLVEVARRTMRDTVAALGEVDRVLSSDRDGEWVGKAAEAFRSMVREELAPRVSQALNSFDDASRAMLGWVGELDDFQRRADLLETRAREARSDVSSAKGALEGLPDVDSPGAQDAGSDHKAATQQVSSANSALSAVLSDARSLAEEVEGAAGVTADRLDSSAGSAPDEPGMFERIGNAIKEIAKVVLESFDDFLDFLDEILPYLIFALAVVSLFVPGLNALVLGLAIAAIAIDVKQAVAGEGSWGDVVMGLAGFGAGAILGKLAKGFMAARGNAFNIRINTPGLALPGGGALSGTATAIIKFNPAAYNMAGMGWVATKFTDLHLSVPPALRPRDPSDQSDT